MISSPRVRVTGAVELADTELRALEVGDQRDRAAELGLGGAHQARALAVLVVGAVREVEARAVHPGSAELARAARAMRDAGPIVATIFVRLGGAAATL